MIFPEFLLKIMVFTQIRAKYMDFRKVQCKTSGVVMGGIRPLQTILMCFSNVVDTICAIKRVSTIVYARARPLQNFTFWEPFVKEIMGA